MRVFAPDFPFRPARVPFFYGYVVVFAAIVGVLSSIPGQTTGVSVFTDHLIGATGVSRLSLSNAYLFGTLCSGLLLPYGGTLIDRFGVRRVVVAASTGLALTLLFLSRVDHAIAALGGAPVVAFGVLVVGFLALRFTGQGMLTLVSRTMLGKWFDRRRGRAAGVMGVFISFGFSAAPLLLSHAIDAAGWRGAWQAIAVAVGLGAGLVCWLLFRDTPEESGLRMDGARPTRPGEPEEPAPVERRYTRGEAARTLAFWAFTLGLAAQGLLITGITFHIVDLGAGAGLSEATAVAIFLPMAVLSTSTGLLVGFLADRFRVQHLLMVMMAFQALGVASMASLDEPLFYWLATVGLGVSGGFFGPLSAVALPRFYGRLHLGAISGLFTMCIVIGSALGPSLLAVAKAATGSYAVALFGGCALPAVAFVLSVLAKDPLFNPAERPG